MYKLETLIGTKFAIDNYTVVVKKYLLEYGEVDIAGMRFVPSTATILSECQRAGVLVRDTEDSQRDFILQQNQNNNYPSNLKEIPLPKLTGNDYVQYLKDLRVDCIYTTYNISRKDKVHIPLVVLALALRGDSVHIAIDPIVVEILQLVSSYLYREHTEDVVNSTDRFYAVYNSGSIFLVEPPTKNLDEKFYMYGLGNNDWKEFISGYYMVPDYFGRVDIRKTPHLDIWRKVISYCGKAIEEGVQHRRQTLKDILGGAID